MFAVKEYEIVKEILLPFSEIEIKDYEFLSLLGISLQALGEYENAISCYQKYLSHHGTNLNVLNSVGECYLRMGNKEEALKVWKKSLDIDPKQEEIKRIVDSLSKNKGRGK